MGNENLGGIFGMFRKPQLFIKKKTTTPKITTLQCTDYLYMGFRIMGVYMPEHHKIPYVIYSIIVNGLVTVYLTFAFSTTFFDFSETESEMGRWLTSIQMAIELYACAIKVVIMAFMIKKIRVADAVMERLDARCQQENDIVELHKLSRRARRVMLFLALIYWSYLTSTALSNVISDAYGVIYVCILRTHMKILQSHVSKLGSDKEISTKQNMAELKLCIKHHKALLELFNIIAPAISLTIFVQFMVTAAVIGIALINLLIFAPDNASIIASSLYIFSVCCETFLLCYYAQCLIEDSEKLTLGIFHSTWVDQGTRFGKMLAFFMQHTQQPMELTAGKLFPITLTTFLNIAKFSFSFYTFIRGMDIKKRMSKT